MIMNVVQNATAGKRLREKSPISVKTGTPAVPDMCQNLDSHMIVRPWSDHTTVIYILMHERLTQSLYINTCVFYLYVIVNACAECSTRFTAREEWSSG